MTTYDSEALRQRLEEAEATLRALTNGEIDAVVIGERDRVLTLEMPEMPYRLAVEQMQYPAVTLTHQGTVIYGNRRFADLLGLPVESLPGQTLAFFVAPESRAAFQRLLTDGMHNETRANVTIQRDPEHAIAVHLGAAPLREGALGACVIVTDLTSLRHYEELRRTQEALRASEEQLRAADGNKDRFLATLAHEMRSPLLAMRNAIEILKAQGGDRAELANARGIIDRQIRVMARLLDDILDVSQIARGTLVLRKERVALQDVIDATLDISRPVIEGGDHTLVLALPPEPVYLSADLLRLSQVFCNLLNNAAKYTEPGGRIEFSAVPTDGHVTVTVRDTGIGIAPDMLPQIFEIFIQGKDAVHRAQGGIGVGLSLVKGLVELHGGSVSAASAGVGRGSEFVVRLPRADR